MKKNIERQVIYWHRNKIPNSDLGSDSFFFSSDMSQYIQFYRKKDNDIKFHLFPRNDEVERLLAPIFSMDSNNWKVDNLDSSVKSLIESISQSIYYEGSVYFEFCKLDDVLKLIKVDNYLIQEVFGIYFQILPQKVKGKTSWINFLENIFKFTFPIKLGGEKRLKNLKLNLSKNETLDALQQLVNGKIDKYFDFEYIKRTNDIEVIKNCYDLGWCKIGEFTEYSHIRLLLNQKKTIAIVRHDILSQINKALLPTILKRLDIQDYNEYSIVAENMETEEYIQLHLNDLENGQKPIDELYNIAYDKS